MVGQGNTSSRTCRSLNTKGAASIVTRLEARALTGNNLQLAIHQHHGYKFHMTWTVNFKYSGERDRCLERWSDTPEECDAFREEVRQHPIQGTFGCVANVWKPTLRKLLRRKKLQRCNLFPTLTARDFDQSGWKQKEMEFEGIITCRCPVSSSERVFNPYL